MSSYIDINQLLREIGASDSLADDPWTLSSNSGGTVPGTSYSPSVNADFGAPIQNLESAMQSSEQITKADVVAPSSTNGSGGSSSSSGGGILSGLIGGIFPLASGIAKLFGLGGSPPTPAPTPYELPPSINFEGAMTSPTSGVTSLTYGATGLAKTTGQAQTAPPANFVNASTEVSQIADQALGQSPGINTGTTNNIAGQLTSLSQSGIASPPVATPSGTLTQVSSGAPLSTGSGNNMSLDAQLSGLAQSSFSAEPSVTSPVLNAGVMSPSNAQGGLSNSSSSESDTSSGAGSSGSGFSSVSAQQGQSILVQVQAMDSQSFMDRSGDIAKAVRQAMLNLNSVNDVIMDL